MAGMAVPMTLGARSVSLLDGAGRPGEAAAQERSAVAAVATLARRYRSAVERAVESGAGLDGAHGEAREISQEAYAVLRRAGVTGMRAAETWAAAQQQA